MAKITLPSDLNQNTEVIFDPSNKKIDLVIAGNLDNDGVTLQALYSFTKDEWRTDSELIKYPFPFIAITGEQFELVNGWDFSGSEERELIRDAGWALRDVAGTTVEEYMNITSLGTFDSGSDNAYYLQSSSGTPINTVFSAEVNQAIQIYSASAPVTDYRDFFKIYLREQGKTYGFYDLISEQNISALTYRKYALPLVNSTDLKITATDLEIDGNTDGTADVSPYDGMSITWYAPSTQSRTIGGTPYDFGIVVDGNSGTAEQIYEFVQWSLRQAVDIDAGPSASRGDTSEELVVFIGDTLRTLQTSLGEGVYIDNFLAADTNRLEFTDDAGTIRTFPFVAAGNLIFNDNLYTDVSSSYFVFFTNDDDGDNVGNDFGTSGAIIINENDGSPITGSASGSATIPFDFDYDGNVQRGPDSSGSNAPFTAVALGLGTAQYVVTTGTITRSTANVINFVAALERNYLSG